MTIPYGYFTFRNLGSRIIATKFIIRRTSRRVKKKEKPNKKAKKKKKKKKVLGDLTKWDRLVRISLIGRAGIYVYTRNKTNNATDDLCWVPLASILF